MQEAFKEEKVPTIIRHFISFSLIYYAYLYLFPFEQGTSAAPMAVKAIKDFAYLGVALTLLTMLPWQRLWSIKSALIFAPFTLALIVASALHSSHTGLGVQVLENIKNIALYVPIFSVPFLVSKRTLDLIIRDLFILLPAMGLLQCFFDLVYHSSGRTLWDYGQFAGLIGNPNSFALFLNIGIACLLAELPSRARRDFFISLALLGTFTWAILRTTSGSQLAILVFLLAFSLAFRVQHWKRYAAAIAVCASVISISSAELDKAMFSMKGAGTIIIGAEDPVEGTDGPGAIIGASESPLKRTDSPGEVIGGSEEPAEGIDSPGALTGEPEEKLLKSDGGEYISRSVTLRRENWANTISVFSKGVADILFGDFDTQSYRAMDGQYIVFMFNGGLITLVTFLFAAAFVYLKTLSSAWHSQDDYLLGLNLIVAAFGITFLASRVLMYFPFNFLFFLIAGLGVTLASRVKR